VWAAAGAVFPHQCVLSVGTNPGPEVLARILLPRPPLSRLQTVLPMTVVTVFPDDRFRRQMLVQGNCGFEI
jgi:hypothetical protein